MARRPIDQSPGDGTLRRAAGGSAAWAADPRPGVHIWAGDIHAPPHGRFRAAISPFTLEGGRRNTTAPTTARLASGNHDWERNEKGQRTEPIERPTGDGVHRRAAGDAAARSAHPCPDDRPLSPSASGVPGPQPRPGHQRRVRTETERLTEPSSAAPCVCVPLSPLRSCRCPINPANRHVPPSPLRSCRCPHQPRKPPCSTFPTS